MLKPSGHADCYNALQPSRIEALSIIDKVARYPGFRANLAQPILNSSCFGPQPLEKHVDTRRKFLNRVLPVLRGIADVLDVGSGDVGKATPQGLDDVSRIIDTECRLRDVGNLGRIAHRHMTYVLCAGDEMNAARDPALRPFHFRMAGVTDEDHLSSLTRMITPLLVDLGHQRAGCVDDRQIAASACSSTSVETPCALKMVTAPSGIS